MAKKYVENKPEGRINAGAIQVEIVGKYGECFRRSRREEMEAKKRRIIEKNAICRERGQSS
jgi:hypothetical protein